MNKIIASIDEEFQAMLSGRFIPYHIAAFMMAIMITLIVSVCARHGEVFEGKIAVIDLDSSQLSTTLIEKLNRFFPLIGVIFGIENKKKKGMY